MDWLEAVVHTTTMGADIVSDVLMNAGAVGTAIEDRYDVTSSKKSDGMWDMIDEDVLKHMSEDVLVKAYFKSDASAPETLHLVEQKLGEIAKMDMGFDMGSLTLDTQGVREQDWAENWKKYYKPFRAGERLVIKPSWEAYEPKDGDLVLELDPGMAFGTGTHETTFMCMEQLEKYVTPGCRAIDVGCGSGILGLAAAKLGAADVLAIDLDELAVKVAAENTEKNGLSNVVRVAHGDLLEKREEKADVIVANIIADVICYLCGPVKKHLLEGGTFICSGIIREREEDVQRALAYWQRAGVLGTEVGEEAQRSFQETPGQQISPVSASTESLAGAGSFAPSAKTAAREAAACDMSRLTSDESFKQLIYIAQQYLNKLLTPTDCQILGNLYSNLGFSGELLEYLIEYCVQNHHTSLRYMEKVALGWHKRGIKDVEQAKASGRGYTKGSFAVMRAMGLSDRSPAEVESEFIEKWFWEYGFTRELIVEACSRTIRQIHKPSFDYADKILRDWKNAGVKSFRDVSELDKKRKEEGGAKRRQASAGSSRSSNRFHNLEEHGYDYDEMVWSMINGAQKTGGDDGTQ